MRDTWRMHEEQNHAQISVLNNMHVDVYNGKAECGKLRIDTLTAVNRTLSSFPLRDPYTQTEVLTICSFTGIGNNSALHPS